MTRNKDHLALLLPQRFYVTRQGQFGDRHVYASRSRFIPAALDHHFVHRTAGHADRTGAPAKVVDLRASLRARW